MTAVLNKTGARRVLRPDRGRTPPDASIHRLNAFWLAIRWNDSSASFLWMGEHKCIHLVNGWGLGLAGAVHGRDCLSPIWLGVLWLVFVIPNSNKGTEHGLGGFIQHLNYRDYLYTVYMYSLHIRT